MRRKRFQNKVAESRLTLPFVAIVTAILWFATGITYSMKAEESVLWNTLQSRLSGIALRNFIGLLMCGLAAYLVAELNNENALIRIRTRMMTSTFVCLFGSLSFLHFFQMGHVVLICVLFSYHTLLRTYQQRTPTGYVFNTFFFLAFSSLFFSKMLFLVPVYLLAMILFLQSFSLKSFFAALLGVVLPYWFWAVYLFYDGRITEFLRPFIHLFRLPPYDLSVLTTLQWTALGSISTMSLVAMFHCISTAFQDKIRVRMLYQFFIFMEVVFFASILLVPSQFNLLFMLFLMNSSTIIAHYFALTSSKATNIFFIVSLIVIVLLAAYSIWSPLFNF